MLNVVSWYLALCCSQKLNMDTRLPSLCLTTCGAHTRGQRIRKTKGTGKNLWIEIFLSPIRSVETWPLLMGMLLFSYRTTHNELEKNRWVESFPCLWSELRAFCHVCRTFNCCALIYGPYRSCAKVPLYLEFYAKFFATSKQRLQLIKACICINLVSCRELDFKILSEIASEFLNRALVEKQVCTNFTAGRHLQKKTGFWLEPSRLIFITQTQPSFSLSTAVWCVGII